jgi:hypothetical protein
MSHPCPKVRGGQSITGLFLLNKKRERLKAVPLLLRNHLLAEVDVHFFEFGVLLCERRPLVEDAHIPLRQFVIVPLNPDRIEADCNHDGQSHEHLQRFRTLRHMPPSTLRPLPRHLQRSRQLVHMLWGELCVTLGHKRRLVAHPDLHTIQINTTLHKTGRACVPIGVDDRCLVHPI